VRPEDVDLTKVNRAMIAERTALLAERDALKLARAQLAVNTLVEVIEGIDQMIAQAGRGDAAAKTMLGRLGDLLDTARAARAGIHLANGR
jgi:hypothetical protein